MKKAIASLIIFFSCIGYFACGGPVNAPCVAHNSEHDCCIAQADCDEYDPASNEAWPALEKACGQGALVMCPTHNDVPQVQNCTFLKVTKACLGRIDGIEGRHPYFYDVLCCES